MRPETGKPWKDRGFYFLLQMEGRDPYIVAPAIAKQKQEEEDTIRPVLIVRYVTMAGEEGLWALKIDPPDGKGQSLEQERAEYPGDRGERQVGSDGIAKKHYRHQVSKKTLEEVPPQFTDRSFSDLVDIAFKG